MASRDGVIRRHRSLNGGGASVGAARLFSASRAHVIGREKEKSCFQRKKDINSGISVIIKTSRATLSEAWRRTCLLAVGSNR